MLLFTHNIENIKGAADKNAAKMLSVNKAFRGRKKCVDYPFELWQFAILRSLSVNEPLFPVPLTSLSIQGYHRTFSKVFTTALDQLVMPLCWI